MDTETMDAETLDTEAMDAETMDTETMDTEIDTESNLDLDINIDELIADFEKVSFFGDQKTYIELYESSKLEISDFETEEIEIILNKTFKRYHVYLKNIGYMDKDIFYDLEKFIRKFQDYNNVDDTELFNFMNYIDNKILHKINESKEQRYWF
jgi:hypothetical protein